MKLSLLCTFANKLNIDDILTSIPHVFQSTNKIFVLEDINNSNNLFVTYNVEEDIDDNVLGFKTILVHRKKETNTLYTINAINTISRNEIGRIDSGYLIDWDSYRNSILLTDIDRLRHIKTTINTIVDC